MQIYTIHFYQLVLFPGTSSFFFGTNNGQVRGVKKKVWIEELHFFKKLTFSAIVSLFQVIF